MCPLPDRHQTPALAGQIAGRTIGAVKDFGYDSLNRLTDNNGRAVKYEENGNITSMESVGKFTYDCSSRPYQITEVELSGDDVWTDREQTVSYTCFSRPSRLNEGGRSAAFTYNGGHDRVKMYVADGTTPVLSRGFTGHEHLPWFGLVNMNARLYDPAVGRFLPPDPYIQMPDFTQSFNRYSYCLNNPLIFVDENGEFFVLDSFIVGLIGGGWKRAIQRMILKFGKDYLLLIQTRLFLERAGN